MPKDIMKLLSLTDKLDDGKRLTHDEWKTLLDGRCAETAEYAAKLAVDKRRRV